MQELTTKSADRARFTRRFAFYESPEVLEQLEQLAADAGRSLASEVRSAIRYWIRAHED